MRAKTRFMRPARAQDLFAANVRFYDALVRGLAAPGA